MSIRTASCQCGQLTVACEGDPVRISMCHCLDCQRRTGSAFGVQARFPADRVTPAGESRIFTRTGDTGNTVTFRFCPHCGSTVYWDLAVIPGFVAVAVGAFADPSFPAPKVAVYEARQHAWVNTPEGMLTERYD